MKSIRTKINKQRSNTQTKFILKYLYLVLASFFLFIGCKKEKINLDYDHRPETEVLSPSLIRVVNLAGHNQVQMDGKNLTNYLVFPVNEPNPYYPPTRYFLNEGQLGTTWDVQRELLDKTGKANLYTEYKGNKQLLSQSLQFQVQENSTQAKDYFILPDVTASTGIDRVQLLPRSNTAPSKPDHIKIRLVNFSSAAGNFYGEENLHGTLKLTFADGSIVDTKITNIAAGKYSEYIEIPYGTYQFRVLTEDGRIVPFVGGQQEEMTDVIHPATSSMITTKSGAPSYLTYAPITSYQPGGSYTIAVSLSPFLVPFGNENVTTFQNGARILTDVKPAANITYARLQVVNTLPQDIVAGLTSSPSTETIPYGKSSNYIPVIKGKHQLDIKTTDGKSLAGYTLEAGASQNYSLWVYQDQNGSIQVAEILNGMSGYYLQDREQAQDASMDRYLLRHPFKVRFLNFCPDEPLVTFTDWDGANFQSYFPFPLSASQRIAFAQPTVESPYIWSSPSNVMAYRSTQEAVPGTWISTVPLLQSTDFVSNPNLYKIRQGMPNYEPGIYTVALIGRTKGTSGQKAKMIIVKHNK